MASVAKLMFAIQKNEDPNGGEHVGKDRVGRREVAA